MTKIICREPIQARYVTFNPDTNHLHILVPIVGGQSVSTDNTCQSVAALRTFFGFNADSMNKKDSVIDELKRYKEALEYDISMLPMGDIKKNKTERLQQIKWYIEAISELRKTPSIKDLSTSIYAEYPQILLEKLSEATSNIYGMHLSLEACDGYLRMQKPLFKVERSVAPEPALTSGLFYELNRAFSNNVSISSEHSLAGKLTQELSTHLPSLSIPLSNRGFAQIQLTLHNIIRDTYAVDIDFTSDKQYRSVNKGMIDQIILADANTRIEDYVNALISTCAPDIWIQLKLSPFCEITELPEKKEKLLIMVQFLLAEINIYCACNKNVRHNFGAVIENSKPRCLELIAAITSALQFGTSVEQAIIDFINLNPEDFGLESPLLCEEIKEIADNFREHYLSIRDADHFDEFMVFTPPKPGSRFVQHQGSICMNVADLLMTEELRNNPKIEQSRSFLNDILQDYVQLICPKGSVEAENQSIVCDVELEQDLVMALLTSCMLDKETYPMAAHLLLSEVSDEKNQTTKLFKTVPPDTIAFFTQLPNWYEFTTYMATQLTTPELAADYKRCFPKDCVMFHLSGEMAKSLYIHAVNIYGLKHPITQEVLGFNTVKEIITVLKLLLVDDLEENLVQPSVGNGFVVAGQHSVMQQLISLSHNSHHQFQNSMYITPEIEASLYLEAKQRCNAMQLIHLDRLSNQGEVPIQFLQVLKLLAIQYKSIRSFSNEGQNQGYLLELDRDYRTMIENIHHARLQREADAKSPERALANSGVRQGLNHFRPADAAEPEADKKLHKSGF